MKTLTWQLSLKAVADHDRFCQPCKIVVKREQKFLSKPLSSVNNGFSEPNRKLIRSADLGELGHAVRVFHVVLPFRSYFIEVLAATRDK